MHHIDFYSIFCFCANLQSAFGSGYVIAPIGATFLRQRAAQLRVAPSRPRGALSGGVPPPPSSTGTATAETSSDADVPPPTASDDSDIRRMVDNVLTV